MPNVIHWAGVVRDGFDALVQLDGETSTRTIHFPDRPADLQAAVDVEAARIVAEAPAILEI